MSKKQQHTGILRPHIEDDNRKELDLLYTIDDKPKPANWKLSPWAVITFILGGQLEDGTEIKPKYFGNRRLIEIAVATLATDRALLLVGIPGTAKTWLSEHLAAAISNDSQLLVQGTAGTGEESLRYGWNYAMLLAKGPTHEAIVPSPVMNAMQNGKIVRVEELTRMNSEVQDALITILSEKTLPVPELGTEISAQRGFNLIATANDKDQGINELSSALRRRFNTVVLPLPETIEAEVKIVENRVKALGKSFDLHFDKTSLTEIHRLVTIFRELRSGITQDGRTRIKSPSATLSTAEAISVINNGQAIATHFGDGHIKAADLAAGLSGTVIKNPVEDKKIWKEYLETVVRNRKGWGDLYQACNDIL